MVVGFVIRQIKKYGEGLDWAKVKADVAVYLKPLPDWIESACVEVANKALDLLAAVLSADELRSIAEKLVSGDVGGALLALKDLIVKLIAPSEPALAAELVKACDDYANCHAAQAA